MASGGARAAAQGSIYHHDRAGSAAAGAGSVERLGSDRNVPLEGIDRRLLQDLRTAEPLEVQGGL